MSTRLFINLPVRDLGKSKKFYTGLGYMAQETFSDDTAVCIKISDTIFVMLLTFGKFGEFTSKPISDSRISTEVINTLTVENHSMVDIVCDKALTLGATEAREPEVYEVFDYMYGRSFQDPDGHIWEVVWMDEKAVPAA